MEEPVEVIIVEPLETDLSLIEAHGSNAAFRLSSVVGGATGAVAALLERRGVERFDELSSVARLLPGVLIIYLGEGLPGAEHRGKSHVARPVDRRARCRLASRRAATEKLEE